MAFKKKKGLVFDLSNNNCEDPMELTPGSVNIPHIMSNYTVAYTKKSCEHPIIKGFRKRAEMDNKCIFSPGRSFRYTLIHEWDPSKGAVMFIGLNPSTADETKLDPTLTRCVNFAKRWGYGSMYMTNIFAYRATDPKRMLYISNPVGEDNDKYLVETAKKSDLIVAAWGNHGLHRDRHMAVMGLLADFEIKCLDITKAGQPKHPLYVRADQELREYRFHP